MKNTQRLSYTRQLRGYVQIAEDNNIKFRIRVRYDTIFSEPLKKPLVAPHKIHNNSLNTAKPVDGYALVPRNNPSVILKYGETTMGTQRYTQKYLNNLVPGGAVMDFRASGTKYEMHYWQHNMILEYTEMHGKRPPFNKSDW